MNGQKWSKSFVFLLLLSMMLFLFACGGEEESGSDDGGTSGTETSQIQGKAYYRDLASHAGIHISLENRSAPGTPVAQTVTDESGKYTISSISPGSYRLYASQQMSLEKVVVTTFDVVADQQLSIEDLFLTPIGSIAGNATLSGADDHGGITVYLEGSSYSAHTDGMGNYILSDIPVGEYTISATYPGYLPATGGTVTVIQDATATVAVLSLDKDSSTVVYNSLVKISDEPEGLNCTDGGQRVDSGLDNGDGGGVSADSILQSGEIKNTAYICNGANGDSGSLSLVSVTAEPPGDNCTFDGQRIDSGLDNGDGGGAAGDGTLQAGEIDSTGYVCNGSTGESGPAGLTSLVVVTEETPGINCSYGGSKIQVGLDNGDGDGTAGDGIFQPGEADNTSYVCNGAAGDPGATSLISIVVELPGEHCTYGGTKIGAGLDNGDGGGISGDGTLQAGEVDSSSYVCDGAPASELMISTGTESPGLNCTYGGTKIEAGLDNGDGGGTAGDGIFQPGEVDDTWYVCNENTPPVAAGFSTVTYGGVSVALTLTASDADGDFVDYSIVTEPGNGTLTGTPPNLIYTPESEFTGYDSFTYKANDGTVDSNVATINIIVQATNYAPVALAGPKQTVAIENSVFLDGSGSYDPEGSSLTYNWYQIAGPTVTLSDATIAQPSFTAPGAATTLSFTLVVNDGLLDSAPDTVTVSVISSSPALTVSGGAYHSMVLKKDGTLWTWGQGYYGQLGHGDTIGRGEPTQVGSSTEWIAIAAGYRHSLAVNSDGNLLAWGDGDQGKLGTGDTTDQLSPVLIGSETNWTAVAAGESHSLGLKSDGTLWAWGDDYYVQLGTGGSGDQLSPVQVGSGWSSISAGYAHNLGIKTDGSLWAWGENGSRQLGLGDYADRAIPTRIGTDNDWISASAGEEHSLGLKYDGTLWAWGSGSYGRLGTGDGYDQSTPVLVGSGWSAIAAGGEHSAGLKADGTLWTWGDGGHGQLGTGDSDDRYVPVQVGVDSDWVAVSAGEYYTVAIKSDGSIWYWGTY